MRACLLGEAPRRIHAAAPKCRETPRGQLGLSSKVFPNAAGFILCRRVPKLRRLGGWIAMNPFVYSGGGFFNSHHTLEVTCRGRRPWK